MSICSVCGKKLGIMNGATINLTGKDISVCNTCRKMYENLQNSAEARRVEGAQYFARFFGTEDVSELLKLLSDSQQYEGEISDSKMTEAALLSGKRELPVTTGYSFEHFDITHYCGIVSSSVVLGTGLLSELSASMNDIFGTTSSAFEDKLSDAKAIALRKLMALCLRKSGNAIIGVSFQVVVTTTNMFIVSATGTAVLINSDASAETEERVDMKATE